MTEVGPRAHTADSAGMQERRRTRSGNRWQATHLLVESLAARSRARAVAVVDERGKVLAAHGAAGDVARLARMAKGAARGDVHPDIPEDTDVFARPVRLGARTVYLAAFGERMRRFVEAAEGVSRILRAS